MAISLLFLALNVHRLQIYFALFTLEFNIDRRIIKLHSKFRIMSNNTIIPTGVRYRDDKDRRQSRFYIEKSG